MTTKYALDLVRIADTITEPKDVDKYIGDVIFHTVNGWKVVVFYDVGEFDYISEFVNPSGEIINFWDWPECEAKDILMSYSHFGDGERLIQHFGSKDEN